MKKEWHWCLFDYGTGEVMLRLKARSAEEIGAKYPGLAVLDGDPPWFEPGETRDPERFPEYDIDAPPIGVLKELGVLRRRGRDKQHYYAEYRHERGLVRRRIWAASLAEIEARYPALEVVPMVVAPPEAWLEGQSEIDVPDDFWRALGPRARDASR